MRILLHDYGGYSFSVQLARELARRGHDVLYVYGESTQRVKRGLLEKTLSDPGSFDIRGIVLSRPFQRYSLVNRFFQEEEYGRLLASTVANFHPDVVLSANSPLSVQAIVVRRCKKYGVRFIFWLHDALGLAAYKVLEKRTPLLSNSIGRYYLWLEKYLVRRSDAVVLISDSLRPLVADEWGIGDAKLRVIPNWAPLGEMPAYPKQNAWGVQYGVADKFCFLYSGVLGMKHDPGVILSLAHHMRSNQSVRIVVVSEGPGADWLIVQRDKFHLDNLQIYEFQSYSDYPQVLASSDVLVGILNSDGALYSVPSKVLTYLTVGRPILLAVPPSNPAAKIVADNRAGIVVDPSDQTAFIAAAERLLGDPSLRAELAANGVAYASKTFDIQRIVGEFEAILHVACSNEQQGMDIERTIPRQSWEA